MRLALLILFALPALAIDGTVVNKTTGKPQPGVPVNLVEIGQGGMKPAGSAKTGPDGKFNIVSNEGAMLLVQATWQGVAYNLQLSPGAPVSGIEVPVYDAAAKPAGVTTQQHMILLETDGKELVVNETVILTNASQTTWSDPAAGTLRFTVPAAAGANLQARATAPGGMPVEREPKKAGAPGVYVLDFAVKPGDTRFDISYKMAVQGESVLEGRILHPPGPTRFVVPQGITVQGDGLEPLGNEPRSQAAVFNLKGDSYKVKISGSGALRASSPQPTEREDDGSRLQEIMPPGYQRQWKLALGLFLAFLAVTFVSLYRRALPQAGGSRKA